MSETNAGMAGKTSPLGDEIVGRIHRLAAISETPDKLTRIFLTPEHRAAAELIMGWMVEAGMSAHLDAAARSEADDGSAAGVAFGVVNGPLAAIAQVDRAVLPEPCVETGAGGEGRPDIIELCGDDDFEPERLFGLR